MKILLILAAVSASAYLEHVDKGEQASEYCQMTAIYKATHGAAGWPPYLGVECEVARAK